MLSIEDIMDLDSNSDDNSDLSTLFLGIAKFKHELINPNRSKDEIIKKLAYL